MSSQGPHPSGLAATPRVGAPVACRRSALSVEDGRVAGRAGWVLFAGAAAAALCRIAGRPWRVLDAAASAAPEVDRVRRENYEVYYSLKSPSRRFTRYVFVARRHGRTAGRLDADLIPGERLLFAQNVFVAEPHRRRGLAAALLVSATLTTGCSLVTTSGRTRDGTAFFGRTRLALKRHGIELRDG